MQSINGIKAQLVNIETDIADKEKELAEAEKALTKQKKLMSTIDELNSKIGKGTVSYACSGIKKNWAMKRELLSNKYTTRKDELAVVKARLA